MNLTAVTVDRWAKWINLKFDAVMANLAKKCRHIGNDTVSVNDMISCAIAEGNLAESRRDILAVDDDLQLINVGLLSSAGSDSDIAFVLREYATKINKGVD